MNTRVGGRATEKTDGKDKVDAHKAAHEEHYRSGMQLASHIWPLGDDSRALSNQMPDTNDDDVNASLVAARASQRKEKSEPLSAPQEDDDGYIMADTDCSVIDIRNCLKEIRVRESPDKNTNE